MKRRTNGAAVRAIREALGIPQDSLAARCEITDAYVSMIETGARQPSPAIARRLAIELAVPLDAITYPWQSGEEFGEEQHPAKAAS